MAVFQHRLKSPGRRAMAAARIEIDQVNIFIHKWLSLNGSDEQFMTVLWHEYESSQIIKCVGLIRIYKAAALSCEYSGEASGASAPPVGLSASCCQGHGFRQPTKNPAT